MSVLALSVPDFLVQLELRRRPDLADKPFALLGPDDRVWAASKDARDYGVAEGLAPTHARARCRALVVRELDEGAAADEQNAFLEEIGGWQLPTEETGYGRAFIALDGIADTASEAQPLAAEMGGRLRQRLGVALTPALGFDHGKFTAGAAADIAGPGRMRLISREDETRFLNPLPVALLPLAPKPISYLGWLGIGTLGQFSGLPTDPLITRFGSGMRMMQQWARGRDSRPVIPTVRAAAAIVVVEFDPPTGSAARVAGELTRALRPHLRALAAAWRGIQRLRIEVISAGGKTSKVEARFRAPASSPARVEAALLRQLDSLAWRGTIRSASAQALRTAELTIEQDDLPFDGLPAKDSAHGTAADAVVAALSRQYPGALLRFRVLDPEHPAAERRGEYVVREPDGGETVERARPVVEPRPIQVVVDANGLPARIGEGEHARVVASCDATWRVATDWWTETGAVNRTYHRVTLADGASLELYFDHGTGVWMR